MPMYDVHRIVDVSGGMDDCVASPRTPYRILRSKGVDVLTIVYSIHARDITAAKSIAAHMESHHTGLPVVEGDHPFLHVMKGTRVSAKLLVSPHFPTPRIP